MINQRSAKGPMPQPAARKITAIFALVMLSIFLVAISSTSRAAEAPVGLGTTESFAVLAGTTVTNTGPTVVDGDLGVSPGTAVTGFPPGIVNNGTIHSADGVAAQAQSDLTTAYDDAAGRECSPTNNLTLQDLGGMTLTPGVYCYSSSAQLTGTVTLNTEGDPEAVFIFQIASTLTTASDSSVSFINGESCNVFWQVGSSATLGTDTAFNGNILALTSIGMDTGATIVNGRTLARNGAVTLDTNTIERSVCEPTPTPTPTPTDAPTPTPTDAPTPTPTPTPTGTPASTPTPTPVLALPELTPTPAPTAAPAATATPTPTQASTPTPAPALIATAAPSSTPMSTPTVSVLGIGGSSEGSESALPSTGASIRMLVLLGLGLIVSGEFLRRRARRTRH